MGQTVAASLQAPQLFVIANDLTQMQVETRIDEADIGRIRPGLPVRFTVDAFPDVDVRRQRVAGAAGADHRPERGHLHDRDAHAATTTCACVPA